MHNPSFDKGEGGYAFLSHSHDDLPQVRKIRNALEAQGFEPLCFYLKCLSDDDELEELIKREIDAREWFIYIDSPNARKSKWVAKERAYIDEIGNKKIMTINLEKETSLDNAAERLMNSMRVFISYTAADSEAAHAIRDYLVARDLRVFFDLMDMPAGSDYLHTIQTEIAEAARRGCILSLLSEASIRSTHVLFELDFAQAADASIIPVMLGDDVTLPTHLEFLNTHSFLKLDRHPTWEQLFHLGNAIENTLLNKFKHSHE